jgi:hypothetical protein
VPRAVAFLSMAATPNFAGANKSDHELFRRNTKRIAYFYKNLKNLILRTINQFLKLVYL